MKQLISAVVRKEVTIMTVTMRAVVWAVAVKMKPVRKRIINFADLIEWGNVLANEQLIV